MVAQQGVSSIGAALRLHRFFLLRLWRSRADAAADALVQVVGGEADMIELMPRIQHIVHNSVMDTKPPPRHPITCEFDGETHKATYWVAGKILTVATGRGGNSKQVGTMEPEVLAKQLLLELVKAGRA